MYQKQIISIIHLYAKEYGWTREFILDNVYLDEHILQLKVIQNSQREDWLMKAQISLLPNYDQKDIKEFLEGLMPEKVYKPSKINKKTDFEAIKKAKEQLKNM